MGMTNSLPDSLAIIVLAAGRGKRMISDSPKVAFSTREKPLIQHVLETASQLKPEKLVVVTGYKAKTVEEVIKAGSSAYPDAPILFAEQKEQLGTGHAARCAMPSLKGFHGTILLLYGDTPLLTVPTLRSFLDTHQRQKATLTILTMMTTGGLYGRIIRNRESGEVLQIKEAKDCTPSELSITECNSGVYAVDSAFLAPALESLKNENAQKEYYFTDIVEKAVKEGQNISSVIAPDPHELLGVNTPTDLAMINRIILDKLRSKLLNSGVILEDPQSLFLDASVQIAPGATIGPNVQIKGSSVIARGVVIEGSAYLVDTQVGENARLKFGVRADQAVIGGAAQIGPFAHLRPGSELAEDVHIGNFVETKKAKLAKGAKANHLTYLGDCTVGAKTNIGAGTITCNYDGYKKYETTIGENVFIGSDTCLVAPVTVEDGSTTGAGSVITSKVEKDSLALTRAPQVSKPGWAKRKRDLMSK